MSTEPEFDQGMAELGEMDDRMDLNVWALEPAEIAAVHRRNTDHLAGYIRARRIHAAAVLDCEVAPMCHGPATAIALKARSQLDFDYPMSLLHSAIALLDQRGAAEEQTAARLMRMDLDLTEAHAELAELREQLEACEDLAAEVRFRPTGDGQ